MSLISEGTDKKSRHAIALTGREEMSVSGVEEVIGFDSDGVRLKSCDGELLIDGEDLKIDTLDTQSGVVSLRGKINGVYYASDNPKDNKKGFFTRLMK